MILNANITCFFFSGYITFLAQTYSPERCVLVKLKASRLEDASHPKGFVGFVKY